MSHGFIYLDSGGREGGGSQWAGGGDSLLLFLLLLLGCLRLGLRLLVLLNQLVHLNTNSARQPLVSAILGKCNLVLF